MRINHVADYRQLRASAYPAIGDQLDAIAKALSALAAQGVALPGEASGWLAQVEAVKTRYPKPGG